MDKVIDAHIHLDLYERSERLQILTELGQANVTALIAVSNHLKSAKSVLELAKCDARIKPAIGFHPEQELPSEIEVEWIMDLIEANHREIVAIGEVGLPYYTRKEDPSLELEAYLELLERFIEQAVRIDKPIVLHAVYEDAPIVCDLLEKYNLKRAHFHWFKGDPLTTARMINNGYFISITPDCLYEAEIQQLIKDYPLEQIMVETDGPWPFEGPFAGELTHPKMTHKIIEKIAVLKQIEVDAVYQQVYFNTKTFYQLDS